MTATAGDVRRRAADPRRRAAIALLLDRPFRDWAGPRLLDTEQLHAIAAAQAPRPGRWYESGEVLVVNEPDGKRLFVIENALKTRGDGRILTQADTDQLITIEIHQAVARAVAYALWGDSDVGISRAAYDARTQAR